MPALAKKPVSTPILVQLIEADFNQFILPHLSMPKRGAKCKLGYCRVFNLILWVLDTGMQGKGSVAIPATPNLRYDVCQRYARYQEGQTQPIQYLSLASVGTRQASTLLLVLDSRLSYRL